jgi:restriction system protein
VVDYALPPVTVIPDFTEFRWIKSRRKSERKPRKAAEIREMYQDLIASITLRSIYEIFETDTLGYVAVVVFSGLVNGVDPATGKDSKPYLISVRVARERLSELDLSRVGTWACL